MALPLFHGTSIRHWVLTRKWFTQYPWIENSPKYVGLEADILSQRVDSLAQCRVRALDFYPGDPDSNPINIKEVGFFQTMHHVLFTNFHSSSGMDRMSYKGYKKLLSRYHK